LDIVLHSGGKIAAPMYKKNPALSLRAGIAQWLVRGKTRALNSAGRGAAEGNAEFSSWIQISGSE